MSTKKSAAKKVAPINTDETVSENVSVEEFANFQKEIGGAISSLTDIVSKISDRLDQPAQPAQSEALAAGKASPVKFSTEDVENNVGESGGPSFDMTPLPLRYKKVVDKYFDTNDGFLFFLEGINFSILVPDAISNMEPAYKLLYKNDLRTKALPPHNFEAGIESWCKLVAQNLRYDLKAVRK